MALKAVVAHTESFILRWFESDLITPLYVASKLQLLTISSAEISIYI